MKISSTVYRRLYLKRKNFDLKEDQTIGSALRYARNILGLTLEEASEGICSISYLSKLETNQIKGSKKLIDQLTERFHIRQLSHEDKHHFELCLNHTIEYLLMNEPFNDALFEPFLDQTDYQGMIAKLLLKFVNQEDDQFSDLFFDIDFMIPALKDLEFSILTIIVAEVLYRHGKYQQAYEIMTFIPKSFDLPYGISIIQKHLMLSCALKMNKTIDLINQYHEHLNELTRMHFMGLYNDMRFKYLEYEACFQNEVNGTKKFLSERKLTHLDRAYLSLKTLYHNGKYHQIKKQIGEDYEKHQGIFAIYLMTLDHLGETEKIEHILKTCNREEKNCIYAKSILNHLDMKIHGTKEEILRYLRQDIMYLKKFPEDMMLVEYLMFDCQKLFEKYQYYKDANQMIHSMMPIIFNLRKAV